MTAPASSNPAVICCGDPCPFTDPKRPLPPSQCAAGQAPARVSTNCLRPWEDSGMCDHFLSIIQQYD